MSKQEKKSGKPIANYDVAFHELMKHKMRDGVSIEDRIRHLVFAIVDGNLPTQSIRQPDAQRPAGVVPDWRD